MDDATEELQQVDAILWCVAADSSSYSRAVQIMFLITVFTISQTVRGKKISLSKTCVQRTADERPEMPRTDTITGEQFVCVKRYRNLLSNELQGIHFLQELPLFQNNTS